MRSHSIITYIVVLPNEPEGDTPFQGFATRLLQVTRTVRSILRLPASFVELHLQRQEVVAERAMTGGYQIIPREVSSLESLPAYPSVRFMIVVSGPGTDEITSASLAKVNFPTLHVTTSNITSLPCIDRLTLDEMRTYCHEAIEFIRNHHGSYSIPTVQARDQEDAIALPLEETGHFVAIPNEVALESLGYQLTPRKEPIRALRFLSALSREEADEPHVKIILSSANMLADVRNAAVAQSSPVPVRAVVDLIVTAPAVFHHIAPELLRPEVPERERKALGIIMRALERQKGYVQFLGRAGDFVTVQESTPAKVLLSIRRAELALYATVLAARASGYAAPVLRLPPAVNHMRPQLSDITRCLNGTSPRKGAKLSKLTNRVGAMFRSEIDPSHFAMIEKLPPHASVKLFTDAPLELLPVRGLPLSMRYVCSRVPVTPGNLFASMGLASKPIFLEHQSLSRILVVNAFKDEDPLKELLRTAITEITRDASGALDFRCVDVDGVDGFRNALNSFDGSILIFDGHGGYSRSLGEGSLQLGSETTDVISLINSVRVPPIVILSACETQPMDGSYATAANAFLALGAQTVLASLVPLEGKHAAILVGRLMLRLAAYLPKIAKTPISPLRWSEIVTGMLRMSYVTDVLTGLRRAGWTELSEKWRRDVQRQSNDLINYLHPEWFEETLKIIADASKRSLEDVKSAHLTEAYFGDSLHYVQLGNPEEIVIVPPSGSAIDQSHS